VAKATCSTVWSCIIYARSL